MQMEARPSTDENLFADSRRYFDDLTKELADRATMFR